MGVVLWSTKIGMERFQLFAQSIHDFSKSVTDENGNEVVYFSPAYNIIRADDGFSEARIVSATALDLFSFLGVKRGKDLKTLLWNRCGQDGDHLRVLGGAQLGGRPDGPNSKVPLHLFVGHSCSTRRK